MTTPLARKKRFVWKKGDLVPVPVELTRHVRTEAGAKRFGEPIGAEIVSHEGGSTVQGRREDLAAENAARYGGVAGQLAKRKRKEPNPVEGLGDTEWNKRYVTRPDDKRKTGGQTPSNFVNLDGTPISKSHIGDIYEEIFRQKGSHLLTSKYGGPYIPISRASGSGSDRTTPLDAQLDKKYGVELKTVSSKNRVKKTAIKKDELSRKFAALIPDKLQPLMVMQVIDQDTKTAVVKTYPQFASVQERRMETIGTYSYSNSDFTAAQKAMGYDK